MSVLKRIVVLCVLAAVIGGCGSSSNGPTKASLVKRADAICTRHVDVITAGVSKLTAGGKLPNPASFGKFAFGTIIPQTSEQIDGLAKLKPPSSLAARYRTWIANLRATLARMKADPVIIQRSTTFTSVNQQANELGLSKNCYLGPSS